MGTRSLICRHCGARIDGVRTNCTSCGKPLMTAAAAARARQGNLFGVLFGQGLKGIGKLVGMAGMIFTLGYAAILTDGFTKWPDRQRYMDAVYSVMRIFYADVQPVELDSGRSARLARILSGEQAPADGAPVQQGLRTSYAEISAFRFPEPDRRRLQLALHDLDFVGPGQGDIAFEASARMFLHRIGVSPGRIDEAELEGLIEAAVQDEIYVDYGTETALIGKQFSNRLRSRLQPADLDAIATATQHAIQTLSEPQDWSSSSGSRGSVTVEPTDDIPEDSRAAIADGGNCWMLKQMIATTRLPADFGAVILCRNGDGDWLEPVPVDVTG